MNTLMAWMDAFDDFMDSLGAPHTTNWPLMTSPSRMLLVVVGYILLVTLIGPKFMEKRKPYKLKKIIIVYNIFQVVTCAVLCIWVLRVNPPWRCTALKDLTPNDLQSASRICWWTMLLKLAELVETVFFVLRKKQNQVSALHVYHHSSTLCIIWGSTKIFPSTMVLVPIMLNSLVHFIMYTYYLLSAAGPKLQTKIMKWKKCITIIQMVQFCVLLIHSSQIVLPHCQVPNNYAYIFIPNVFLVFYMFYKFYKQAYSQRIHKQL